MAQDPMTTNTPAEFDTSRQARRGLNAEVDNLRSVQAQNEQAAGETRLRTDADRMAVERLSPSERLRRIAAVELDKLRSQAAAGEAPKSTRAQRAAERVSASTVAGTVAKGKPPPKLDLPQPTGVKTAVKPTGDGTAKKARAKRRKKGRERRKKFINKIPRKYKKTRGIARLGLGGVAALWGGAKITGRVAKWSSTKVAGRAKSTAQKRKWTPRAAVAGWRSGTYKCCGETYSSAAGLNDHFIKQHLNEDRAGTDDQQDAVLAPTRGGVKVLLPPTHGDEKRKRRLIPVGKHRKNKDRTPALAYLNAHRRKLDEIGVKAMTEIGETRAIAQGFRAWGDLKPPAGREWTLAELRGILTGLERAILVGGEALDQMERTLNRPRESRGCNIDQSVTRSGMRMARDGAADMARGVTRVIADFESTYAPFINQTLTRPAINTARR